MEKDQILLVNKQILSHLFDTIQRAKQYHYHAQSMQVAQGVLREGAASPLLRDLQLSIELLDGVLNPHFEEQEIIEG